MQTMCDIPSQLSCSIYCDLEGSLAWGGGGGGGYGGSNPLDLSFCLFCFVFCLSESERLVMYDGYPYSVWKIHPTFLR